ncbi:MAG: hypothetical protein ABEJ87_03445 [Candidatus Nanohalobium sp.]
MGFFDRGDGKDDDENTEEVTLSVPDENGEAEAGNLRDEAEARLTGGDSSDSGSSEQDTSGMLPGMGSGSSSSSGSSRSSRSGSSSGDVSLEDIHRQNKQIKSILKDIRSELKDEGDMNGVL